jgi:hypothetical protein
MSFTRPALRLSNLGLGTRALHTSTILYTWEKEETLMISEGCGDSIE